MDVNQYSNILLYIDIMKSLHWYRPLDIENTQRKKHTPLKISNRTAVETSTKLPVTDLKQAPFQGADSNLHRYKQHKKDAIYYCHSFLENEQFSSWKSHFLHHKKKDDLADCFLQGIWYLQNKNNNIHCV